MFKSRMQTSFQRRHGVVRRLETRRGGRPLRALLFSLLCVTIFVWLLPPLNQGGKLGQTVLRRGNVSNITVILTEFEAISAFSVVSRLADVLQSRAWCTSPLSATEVTAVFVLGATASRRGWHGDMPASCVSCGTSRRLVHSDLSLWRWNAETPCVARVFVLFNDSATPNADDGGAVRDEAQTYGNALSSMVQAALSAVEATDYFLLVDGFLTPMRDFMQKLIEPLGRNNGRVLAVQCTIVEPLDGGTQDGRDIIADGGVFDSEKGYSLEGFRVLDGGALVRLAVRRRKEWLLPYILRRHNGHGADDARVVIPELLDAVSPFCTIFHRGAVDAVGGFLQPTLHDTSEAVMMPMASSAPDFVSWDLSIRMQEAYPSWQVWSSEAFATIRADSTSQRMRNPLLQAAYSATDDWGASWLGTLERLQGRRNAVAREGNPEHSGNDVPLAPLLFFFRDYNCLYCGLTREMISYLRSLGERYSVLLADEGVANAFDTNGAEEMMLRLSCEKEVRERFDFVWETRAWRRAYMRRRKIVIMHMRAHYYEAVREHVDCGADYFIGRSLSESSRIPPEWVTGMQQHADEVWATGDFLRRVYILSGVSEGKIHTVPEALDVHWYNPRRCKPLPLPLSSSISMTNMPDLSPEELNRRYRFLSVFKWEARKGWDFLLEAYWKAFGPSSTLHHNVSLYIKVQWAEKYSNDANDANVWEWLTGWARRWLPGFVSMEQFPHLVIVRGDVPFMNDTMLRRLYCTADAFVIPTRGEGWGLPAAEAMLMELPLLTTNWGGSTAFMTRNVTFGIPVDGLEEVPPSLNYTALLGNKWAIPSINNTAHLMRYVVENPAHARTVGKRARRHIVTYFSEQAVADIIDKRIAAIYNSLKRRYFW